MKSTAQPASVDYSNWDHADLLAAFEHEPPDAVLLMEEIISKRGMSWVNAARHVETGWTIVHYAASYSTPALLQTLYQKHAIMNATTLAASGEVGGGSSCLHVSVLHQRVQNVHFLLKVADQSFLAYQNRAGLAARDLIPHVPSSDSRAQLQHEFDEWAVRHERRARSRREEAARMRQDMIERAKNAAAESGKDIQVKSEPETEMDGQRTDATEQKEGEEEQSDSDNSGIESKNEMSDGEDEEEQHQDVAEEGKSVRMRQTGTIRPMSIILMSWSWAVSERMRCSLRMTLP